VPHEKHRSAIFAKAGTTVESTLNSSFNNIETLRTTLDGLTITSVYKPPSEPFCIARVPTSNKEVFTGDFNSHSTRDPTFREFVPKLGISARFGETFGELRYLGIF